jgi:predicted transcriptional regulator
MSLWHLPRELYAEISRFLVDDIHDVSRLIRKLAKKNIVKDIRDGKTYN